MLRLTVGWIHFSEIVTDTGLIPLTARINLILSPAYREAADDVIMLLSANYITGKLPVIY